MVAETFAASLRALANRMTFRPFTVELLSGERFTVDHPEALAFGGGLAVYVAPDGKPSLFDHKSVSRLIGQPDAGSASSADRG